ncbi:ATP-binding protein [Burkholderia latens]|uniref:ATP-binding protein n=1 Tax=Burkholderia latens TaxID=488446 RepID=UPI001AE83798|nr:ATP-binding protein [Burkholderia latens]MBR7964233.1 response regulator [Burkholderia vietnamiensis]QTO46091.1 response regulator [Burkholderia latens]
MVNLKGHALLISLMIGLGPSLGLAETPPQFTAEEKAWIAAHPVVRTRVDSNWRPFEFREGGKVLGIVPSYLDAVSRISGLRFEYADDVSLPNTLDAFMSGQIDMVPDVSSSADRSRYRDISIFSQPYFVGTMVVVASESSHLFVDFRNLSGSRVAIKGGGGLEYGIRHSGIPVILLTYADERDALAAVADGDADVAVGTDASIVPLLRRQFKGKLFVSGGLADRPYALAFATRRDLPLLASILDKSLASIPARESEEIPRRWIESVDYGKPTLHSILYYHRWQVVAASVTLLGLVAVTFVSWRSRKAAVRSEREKAMFVAFISHEIRTPMHTILASLELLQHSRLTPKQAARADAAVGASESLLMLLDDILEYSRLESHSVTLAPEPTHVMQWARRSADMVRWRVEEKRLGLTLEIACSPELCVLIDPIRTRQIVLNLLVNAIKFTSAGSIVLRVDFLAGKTERAGSLVIEVRDTGIGIPHERQRRIFEPYQRVEEPGSGPVSGSGLGLAICRELVGLMKGAITVSSNPGIGTVFTVMLPVRAQPPSQSPVHESDPAPVAQPASTRASDHVTDVLSPDPNGGPMILVVDDHEAVQHAIQHQLDALACRSTIAGTGEAALEKFERMPFDMVLLDCNLPGIDGYTVAQRMRDIECRRQGKRTPVIAISAATDDAHRVRCLDSGMDGVLGKPVRLAVLRNVIELWCASYESDVPDPLPGQAKAPRADFSTVFRQSVDGDLETLARALQSRDIDLARHAAHRIKGAAAVAGKTAMHDLAADLEHRLRVSGDGIAVDVDGQFAELQRMHRADTMIHGSSDASGSVNAKS